MSDPRSSILAFANTDFSSVTSPDNAIIGRFLGKTLGKTVFYDNTSVKVSDLMFNIETFDQIQRGFTAVENDDIAIRNFLMVRRADMTSAQVATHQALIEEKGKLDAKIVEYLYGNHLTVIESLAPFFQAINGLVDAAIAPLTESLSHAIQKFEFHSKGLNKIFTDALADGNLALGSSAAKVLFGTGVSAAINVNIGQVWDVLKGVKDVIHDAIKAVQNPGAADFGIVLDDLSKSISEVLNEIERLWKLDIDHKVRCP